MVQGSVIKREFHVVNAFTGMPLTGSQLAVITDASGLGPTDMRRLAAEFGHSETAFVFPGDDNADAMVRIFTPAMELPFGGNALLGAAHVLGETTIRKNVIVLRTAGGLVSVQLTTDDVQGTFAEIDQPQPRAEQFSHVDLVLEALGVREPVLPVMTYRNGPLYAFVQLASAEQVAALEPDLRALARFNLAVGCFAGSGSEYSMRVFAPGFGVDEDAATGSAAGPLALYLTELGAIGLGRRLRIHQGERLGRPATLYVSLIGLAMDQIQHVYVGGFCVTVAEGTYRIA
jgi:trans-2,3-dihydro-3-hydroxyanthranilate isomerase